jgi:hypothetical protein
MASLSAWASFYVIVGSSAGALTGLTFVVISLIAQVPQRRGDSLGLGAYTTPTIVHFGEVLAVSAVLSAPWPTLASAAMALGLCSLGGLAYTIIVLRRLRRMMLRRLGYDPVFEDWLAHAISPLASYTVLVVAAVLLPAIPVPALFGVGAVLLVLLFTSIHNAWDTVIYITIVRLPQATARDNMPDESEGGETADAMESDKAADAAQRES